ncbi:hypothetical protein [Marinomonas aquiplantarum]|uniref:Uncharacterized protein n=1 Tax=Marinomonas aquiplantarum TaxID=491951 RepID=A0A366CUG6_9GAMM|nr:hypothetical protein [Marinomonas aquiplantarum]RBO78388.1 hypothetical protein DFP76_11732 [Marinomonas aquiplantarum]
MNDNLILFPRINQRSNESLWPVEKRAELIALREEFDRAREDWPLEMAELPENNKRYCGSEK